MMQCGGAPIFLEAIGFQYDCEMAPDAFKRAARQSDRIEYLGWLINPDPGWGVIVVIHIATRHLWISDLADFEVRSAIARVKALIRRGFEMDLEKLMQR